MDYNFLVLEYFLLRCVLLMVMWLFEKERVYLLLFYSIVFHMNINCRFHRIFYHNKESVLILIKLDEEDIVLMEIFDESFYEVLIRILYLLCFILYFVFKFFLLFFVFFLVFYFLMMKARFEEIVLFFFFWELKTSFFLFFY